MGTSQIMDSVVQQSGGYNNVGFTKKYLYNHVDADRRVHLRDGDAECALAYLCGKFKWIHHFITNTMLMKTTV